MASSFAWQQRKGHAGENSLEAGWFGGPGHRADNPEFDSTDGKGPQYLSQQGECHEDTDLQRQVILLPGYICCSH